MAPAARQPRRLARPDVDALWGERPPETAVSALQGYIAGLRKVIGADRIETRTSGYRLQADPSEIDLARFQSWSPTRLAEPQAALLHCDQALALWRDLPLAELDSAPFVEAERRRLEELRLAQPSSVTRQAWRSATTRRSWAISRRS